MTSYNVIVILMLKYELLFNRWQFFYLLYRLFCPLGGQWKQIVNILSSQIKDGIWPFQNNLSFPPTYMIYTVSKAPTDIFPLTFDKECSGGSC